MAAQSFFNQIQKIYIAFYGRPADPDGLLFWAQQADTLGLQSVVRAFGTSQESVDLYGNGPTVLFVRAVYRQLFNREADTIGLRYWADRIDGVSSEPRVSRSEAAFFILQGAVDGDPNQAGTADLTVINKKAAVADRFTSSVNTQAEINAYKGNASAQIARDFLATITANTNVNQVDVDPTINTIQGLGNQGGPSFILTTNAETVTGGGGDDSFVADNRGAQPVTQTTDSLDGGGGSNDQLTIFGAALQFPRITRIEKLVLNETFGNFDLSAVRDTGAASSSLNAVTLNDIKGSVVLSLPTAGTVGSVTLSNTSFANVNPRDVVINFNKATSEQQTVNLTVRNVNFGASNLSIDGAYATVALVSEGTSNAFTSGLSLTSTQTIERLLLSGSGTLDLGRFKFGTYVRTTDASAMGAGVTLGLNEQLGAGGAVVAGANFIGSSFNDRVFDSVGNDGIQTGSGDDVIFISTGVDSVEAGLGNDTLVSSVNALTDTTFATITGVESVVTAGAGTASDITLGANATRAGVRNITTADNAESDVILNAGFTNGFVINTGNGQDEVVFNLARSGGGTINTADGPTPSGVSASPESLDLITLDPGTLPFVGLRLALGGVGNADVRQAGATSAQDLAVRMQQEDAQGNASGPVVLTDDEGVFYRFVATGNSAVTAFKVFDTSTNAALPGAFDVVYLGTSGNDTFTNVALGRALFEGGQGNDSATGGNLDDYLSGGQGDDALSGAEGSDTLMGGAGNDTLGDGAGRDVMVGGDGNDTLTLAADGELDVFAGLAGNDTITTTDTMGVDEVHFRTVDGTDTLNGFNFGAGTADLIAFLDNGISGGTGAVNFAASDSTAGAAGTRFTAADVTTSSSNVRSYLELTKAQVASTTSLLHSNVILKVTDATAADVLSGLNFGKAESNIYLVVAGTAANTVNIYFESQTQDNVTPTLIGTFTGVNINDMDVTDFGVYTTV